MSSFDEELLQDEQETLRELAFIRERLPLDLKEQYTDGQLRWMLDAIVDYYVDSGILDSADEEVDIDLEAAASHLCQRAADEGLSKLDPQDVFFVVEADLDFQEQSL